MSINGHQSIAMIDNQHQPIASKPVRIAHLPGGNCLNLPAAMAGRKFNAGQSGPARRRPGTEMGYNFPLHRPRQPAFSLTHRHPFRRGIGGQEGRTKPLQQPSECGFLPRQSGIALPLQPRIMAHLFP